MECNDAAGRLFRGRHENQVKGQEFVNLFTIRAYRKEGKTGEKNFRGVLNRRAEREYLKQSRMKFNVEASMAV